jgi:hypothetical protein
MLHFNINDTCFCLMCYFFNLDVCFFFVKDPVKLIPGAMIEIMVEVYR